MTTVTTAAAALGLLAVILVGPGPLWVGRWTFLHQVPRAAVVLWQAGTVAALVSVIGAGVLIALPIMGDPGLVLRLPPAEAMITVLVAAFTAIVIGRLIWSLIMVGADTSARRRRHRVAVDLLGRTDETRSIRGLRILAEKLPMAYCLPGLRESRVVLSAGALDRLSEDEVTAVLEHEAAHVRARHDLVLDAFQALHRAFPVMVRSEMPWLRSQLLVEMLADDAARRRTGPLPLARALVAMAGAPSPSAALAAGDRDIALRVARLAHPDPPPKRRHALAALVYLLSTTLLLLPLLPLALAPWTP
ncbi:M56 family metallopeptidase [Microlunatus speluncae]|uniref:M56 family metallopeptidase n=1 Tax=Microlunatus speluncae TaxID=2594267 RepID=UPI00126676E4|nr:M56 family metallopeptidase [Microlunatus speluncae]